jgi:prepilin-type N-terminal cleavage/methylation domain-containing protein
MLKKAFSLIELSIAIMVISILIVGFLNVSSGKGSNNKAKITKDRIDIVYKSLGEFVLKNKRLPCPASIKAIKTVDANYGIEGTAAGTCTAGTGVYLSTASGATNMVYGMIPVKSLGLSNDYGEDGFGSKFAYIVDKTYTIGTTFSTSSGSVLIQKYINGAYVSDSNNAIFAIISYGPNKSSSFNANSSSQNMLTSDVDEMFNDPITLNDGAKTADFTQTLVNSSERSTIFDDIVFYKSRDNFLKDSKALNIVNGNITSSANVAAVAINLSCTGGSKTNSGGFTIHTMTSNTNLTCNSGNSTSFSVLAVGGGGAGGAGISGVGPGGGGGGGQVVQLLDQTVSSLASVSIVIGLGASNNSSSGETGGTGGDSTVTSSPSAINITAKGGIGGGGKNQSPPNNDDSTNRPGGGAGSPPGAAGFSSNSSGNKAGGTGYSAGPTGGRGGGGASTANPGGNATTTNSGAGAQGSSSSISGSSAYYGCGGAGGGVVALAGNCGTSSYGYGASGATGSAPGAPNKGAGGGGGGGGNIAGSAGSNGVVIISYSTL